MANALLEAVKSKILEFSPINQQIFSHYLEGGTTEDLITAAKGILESEGYEYIQYGTGADAYFDVYKTVSVSAGNGASTEVVAKSTAAVSEIVETETGVSTTLTGLGTGSSILATDVGLAGAAIAPALGLLAGVSLYNLAPEFWTNVSNKLMDAGKLIAGKVQGLFNSDGTTSYDEETIEIYKQAFIDADLFVSTYIGKVDSAVNLIPNTFKQYVTITDYLLVNSQIKEVVLDYKTGKTTEIIRAKQSTYRNNISEVYPFAIGSMRDNGNSAWYAVGIFSKNIFEYYSENSKVWMNSSNFSYNNFNIYLTYSYSFYFKNNYTQYYSDSERSYYWANFNYIDFPASTSYENTWRNLINYILWTILYQNEIDSRGNFQPDATIPTDSPFPSTYPDWQPTKTINNIKYYPVSMPTDDITQLPSQTGDNDYPEQQEKIINVIYYPESEPDPTPTPEPDPDPQPEPEPMPGPIVPTIPTDPLDPNPDPNPGDIPVAILPPSVSVSRLTTVYNPDETQLNALGAFLWSEDIITALLKMWQDPLSGVISLRKVYATPSTGASKDIILGYLNSGVSAPIVTSQFVTIDCGLISIEEDKKNATDYTPYVSIQLYLPFIGVVELDPDEIMAGALQVVYHIDMYTGTCLAEVKVVRNPDVPIGVTIYTFSGNCSQDVPLTSGNMNGLMSTLASLGAVAIGAGSGGMLGMMSAGAIGHSLTHEMMHVNHSGSLSSNAGIMGARKPYVILSRRHGYDANGYSELYGYPSNKTVYLGNCEGYTRVKAVRLKIPAYQQELEEIESLLKEGVIM